MWEFLSEYKPLLGHLIFIIFPNYLPLYPSEYHLRILFDHSHCQTIHSQRPNYLFGRIPFEHPFFSPTMDAAMKTNISTQATDLNLNFLLNQYSSSKTHQHSFGPPMPYGYHGYHGSRGQKKSYTTVGRGHFCDSCFRNANIFLVYLSRFPLLTASQHRLTNSNILQQRRFPLSIYLADICA